MKEVIVEQATSSSVLAAARDETGVARIEGVHARRYPAYVGIDQHKEWLVVAVAIEGRDAPEDWGRFENSSRGIKKLLKRLARRFGGEVVSVCYEAGPCGYGLYRTVRHSGHDCLVVAPTTVPMPAGQRRKTDQRDARLLARSLRNGDLRGIHVPDSEQQDMRALTRARQSAKSAQRVTRQHINSYLLQYGKRYTETKSRWTQRFYRWLAELTMDNPLQQTVLQDLVDAEERATQRLKDLEQQMQYWLPKWSQVNYVYELRALRGIDWRSAMVLVAELGDLRRFGHPNHLMAYLGLIPGEDSSGDKYRRLSTGHGNRHVRRMLIEAAWCYKTAARKSKHLKNKMERATQYARDISWKAQKRLCGRYRDLSERGKSKQKITVAIARELCGFLWAIYQNPEKIA